MVSPVRWGSPALVLALLVASAVGLGIQSPDGPTVAPPPPEPEEVEESAVDDPRLPPSPLRFTGHITIADPTRVLMGAEPMLWSESCHRLDLQEGRYTKAVLILIDGATSGQAEDLDLFAYDDERNQLVAMDGVSTGYGVHHELDLPSDTTKLVVCLAGGARADYETLVS